jgi:hypothetical protein
MTIKKIKKEMLAWRDIYGGDLIGLEKIESATTKKQLNDIMEEHRSHLEMMLCDAHSHLDRFKQKLGLSSI